MKITGGHAVIQGLETAQKTGQEGAAPRTALSRAGNQC